MRIATPCQLLRARQSADLIRPLRSWWITSHSKEKNSVPSSGYLLAMSWSISVQVVLHAKIRDFLHTILRVRLWCTVFEMHQKKSHFTTLWAFTGAILTLFTIERFCNCTKIEMIYFRVISKHCASITSPINSLRARDQNLKRHWDLFFWLLGVVFWFGSLKCCWDVNVILSWN